MAVVCLSVCLSLSDSKSRMEGHRKLKIDRKEASDKGDPLRHSEVERSKVKCSSPIKAENENASYFPKGGSTNFKLGTGVEYEDSHHRHAQ